VSRLAINAEYEGTRASLLNRARLEQAECPHPCVAKYDAIGAGRAICVACGLEEITARWMPPRVFTTEGREFIAVGSTEFERLRLAL
jgi:hypothetical protein